jgi:hypothetical protein
MHKLWEEILCALRTALGSFLATALSAFSSPVAAQPTNASAVFTAAARKTNIKAE